MTDKPITAVSRWRSMALESSANLAAERRVSYAFKQDLDDAEEKLSKIMLETQAARYDYAPDNPPVDVLDLIKAIEEVLDS